MSDIIDIIISAVDQASDVFRDIVSNVNDMGSSISDVTGMASAEFDAMSENVAGFQEAVADIDDSTIEALAMDLEMTTEEVERLIETGQEVGSIPFDEATANAEELSSTIESLDGSTFDTVSDDANELAGSFENARSSAEGLSDELGIISAGMLIQTADSVGNLAGDAEGMATSINNAAISVGQLATATGLAEPEIVNLINYISNETFPQEEAMAYVEALHQMGVESSNFGSSATSMDRINDAFGIGYTNVIQLTRAMGVLGVDASNLESSYNALAYVNSNVNGGVSTLTTVLGRQGATFSELGLDIDQTALILDAASHKWTTARTLNSGLSSALKDCGGDLRALEKELGLQEGALDNASDATKKYEGQVLDLASEEMSHKTILQRVGAVWEDISLSVSGALAPLAGAAGLIGQVGQFGMQVQGIRNMGIALKDTVSWISKLSIVESALNTIRGVSATEVAVLNTEEMALAATQAGLTAEEVGAAAAHAANGAAIAGEGVAAAGASTGFWALAAAVIGATWPILLAVAAAAAFVYAIYEIGKAFGWWSDVGGMIDAIWDGVQRLWSAFINHPDVQAFIKMLTDGWNNFVSILQGAGKAVLDFFGINTSGSFDIVASIIHTVGNAWNGLKGIIGKVSDSFEKVKSALGPFGGALLTILSPLGIVIAILRTVICALIGCSPGIVPALQKVQEVFGSVWSSIVGIISPIINTIVATINGLINIFNAFRSGQINVGTTVVSVLKLLLNSYTSILTYISSFVLQFAGTIAKYALQAGRNFVNNIVNRINKLPGRFLSYLTKTSQHIISQGTKWVNTARTKANQVVTGVVNYIKNLPSKTLSYLVKVVSSISTAGGKWITAAGNYASKVVSKVITNLSNLPGKVATEFGKIPGRINSAVSSAVSAAASFGSNIKNAVLKALHIASPGIIQRKIKAEFWDTVERIKETARPAYEAGKNYGQNILNGFNSIDLSRDSLLDTSDFNTAIDVNGNTFDITTGQYYEVDDNLEITVKQEHEFTFSFKDVPEWIDTDKLISMIKAAMKDKTLIRELVNNPDFQKLDAEVKDRILRKVKRSKGV